MHCCIISYYCYYVTVAQGENKTRMRIGVTSHRAHQSLKEQSVLHPIHACYKRQLLQLWFSLRGDFCNSIREWYIR